MRRGDPPSYFHKAPFHKCGGGSGREKRVDRNLSNGNPFIFLPGRLSFYKAKPGITRQLIALPEGASFHF